MTGKVVEFIVNSDEDGGQFDISISRQRLGHFIKKRGNGNMSEKGLRLKENHSSYFYNKRRFKIVTI
ncbi:18236_t:CDS:2, partial [Racocetra persica]